MPLEPIPVEADAPAAVPVVPSSASDGAPPPFELRLPVFEGPLQLLLHLIESRQLDVLSVPLAEVADAYVEHLARHPVDAANLSEFVAIAARLVLLKSRRILPGEPPPVAIAGEEEPDEEELRRRLIDYRIMRDAALALGQRDLAAPLMRREPREADLPEAPAAPLPASLLTGALERLAAVPEPVAPPPAVMVREITIGMQIAALRRAMGGAGQVVLQSVLAACRSRTEVAVTVLAALELVRRRQATVAQEELFGPIIIAPLGEPRQ
jgi:segregation and condensation protein A